MKNLIKNTVCGCLAAGLLAFVSAKAENTAVFPKILTEQYPILNYTDDKGKLTGVSTEIVMATAKEIGNADCKIQVVNWVKGLKETESASSTVALYSTIRSPERESHFKWVGPIVKLRQQLCKLRSNPLKVRSLEDAKKVAKIGIYHGDALEKVLLNAGLQKNIDRSMNGEACFDKLVKGEIDLWATSDVNISGMAKSKGIDLSVLEVILTFHEDPLYIAFSNSTPDETIALWQRTFNTLKKDHKLDEIYKNWGVEAP